jgi:hypothetical protein
MKIFAALSAILLINFLNDITTAQNRNIYEPKPVVEISGGENFEHQNVDVISTFTNPAFNPVNTTEFIFNVHSISPIKTGYDFQSNASTQQVWADYFNPQYLHATFTNSQQSAGYSDRKCIYFGSTDAGVNWFELGQVPSSGRAGFPSIYGKNDGSAVLLNHNNFFGGFVHTTVSADATPFGYNFTDYDPGNISDGPVWPRHVVTANDIVVFASSGSPAPDDDVKLNSLDLSTGLFSGWTNLASDDAEQYDFAISPGGKIGLAYTGWSGVNEDGDVLYKESTDNGITWSGPVKIYDSDNQFSSDTAYGSLRGISVNFFNEEPCVTYEICLQIFSSNGSFFPGLPSEIQFWSPNINGGVPKVIADSSNVPYYPYVGTNDTHVPVCRPVIGRADNGYLFVAFNTTTEHVFPSPDTTSYMAGYFMYSVDGGETWSVPEKFTPDSPLLDWRYPSIAEVVPVTTEDESFTIHIVMQGDSIPGSTVNTGGMPVGVTAQYYHFSADVSIGDAGNDASLVTSYTLEQNYPNPFNPATVIKYGVPEASLVQLKIYDVLGNELATLVNEEKHAGTHQVEFDASEFSSGVYFYTMKTNGFAQTKKMVVAK